MGQWSFAAISPKQVRRDPFEAEFFVGAEDSEQVYGRTDALVREAIQNSLDARRGDVPATVRFEIRQLDAATSTRVMADYLSGLGPHLSASGNDLLAGWLTPPPLRCLVYEDFGTRGLCGDPARTEDPPGNGSAGRQDFYWFWRSIGRSGKGGQDLGRWGLGKSVLPATSKINTMFGLTVRAEDGRRMLMGQAVLKTHRVEGTQYLPEGFYHDLQDKRGVPLPIEDPEVCDRFASTFGLTRGRSDPGLSVVVPLCFDTLNHAELLRSVIVHYFVPILRGQLVAEVWGPGARPVRVDRQTIRTVSRDLLEWSGPVAEKKHAPPPFDFAEWAIGRQAKGIEDRLHLSGIGRVPEWKEELFPPELLQRMRRAFAGGERIAIRVPLRIERLNGTTEDTHFDAFLTREDGLERGEDHYVREGMTVSNVSEMRGWRGLRGLVLVDDKPLSTLLGDAEGPAHNDWGTGETRPDRVYVKWKRRVSFVKLSLRKLADLLTPPPEDLDRDLLGEVFNVSMVTQPGRNAQAAGGNGQAAKPFPPDLHITPRWYRLSRVAGGFRLLRNSVVALPTGPAERRLRVAVAYDLPSGDPLKNWSRFDFDFMPDKRPSKGATKEPITFAGRDTQLQAVSGNTMDVVVTGENFLVQFSGFDPHRDLYVRVSQPELEDGVDASGAGGGSVQEGVLS